MGDDHALADYVAPDDLLTERPETPPAEDRAFRTAAQVRRFLLEFANTREDWVAVRQFFDRYGRVLPGPIWFHEEYRDDAGFSHPVLVDKRFFALQKAVREAWLASDDRQRNYILLPILAPFIRQPHQPRNVLDQAFWYLIDHAGMTRLCPNDGCPAPYFFKKHRGQRYCTAGCTADAQRAYKRKWWAENGAEWRQQRQRASAQKSRGRRRR
jgi:hypothetical protein